MLVEYFLPSLFSLYVYLVFSLHPTTICSDVKSLLYFNVISIWLVWLILSVSIFCTRSRSLHGKLSMPIIMKYLCFFLYLQDGHDSENSKQSTADMTVFVSSISSVKLPDNLFFGIYFFYLSGLAMYFCSIIAST